MTCIQGLTVTTMNWLSAREQWLTVSRQCWDSTEKYGQFPGFRQDHTSLTLSLSHTHTHGVPRSADSTASVCCLTSLPFFTLCQAASFWRYLPTAEMFAFRHLLQPSAHNMKSCQVSFYTVSYILMKHAKNVIICGSVSLTAWFLILSNYMTRFCVINPNA